jgi:diamine N-acetyltransferase
VPNEPSIVELSQGYWHPWRMHSADNKLELIELTYRARDFLLLDVHENQKNLVASVAQSFSDALFPPDDPNGPPLVWMRGVLRNAEPAGFVMCADQTEQQKDPWLWRLLVDKSHQGFGVGTFALTSVIERYRELGMQRVLTAWHPGEGNAGDFYKKFGFIETGEKIDEEIVAELKL